MNIQSLLSPAYIHSFIKREKELEKRREQSLPVTLFEPNFDALKEMRCIHCGNKLRVLRCGKSAFCPSKKHRSFIIGMSKLKQLQKI